MSSRKMQNRHVNSSAPDESILPQSLWFNHQFTIFWVGQTLSNLGDAFALIAMPLLVFQATGSVAQMGIVTGIFSAGQIIAGLFSGTLVDSIDRRKLMIACDLLRFLLYALIPCIWLIGHPTIWLIYVVSLLGSCLGLCFQVAYNTAVANLVTENQIVDANSRLQVTYAIAFVIGPMLAGLILVRFGAAIGISFDALSFLCSLVSLMFVRIRTRPLKDEDPTTSLHKQQKATWYVRSFSDFVLGGRYLWGNFRTITIIFMAFSLVTAAGVDLFIFHLKHDLHQGDSIVGLMLCLASIGSIIGGGLTPLLRRRLGFRLVWLGGICLEGIFIGLIGPTSFIIPLSILTIGFTFGDTILRVSWISLRQQVTPDHLLGRVTAVFWTVIAIPMLIGSTLTTYLASILGTPFILLGIGSLTVLISLIGYLLPRSNYQTKTDDTPLERKYSIKNVITE